jgi:hypothetical protein
MAALPNVVGHTAFTPLDGIGASEGVAVSRPTTPWRTAHVGTLGLRKAPWVRNETRTECG